MIKGIRDLRQIQIGFQYDADGGACANPCDPPIARLVGQCGMKRLVNRVFPTEATGIMSDHIVGRSYDPWVMAEVPIGMGDEGVTFQQLPWYLAMGAAGGVIPTPTAVLTWEFCPDLVAGDMPDVATIRYGDNAAAWISSCCFARQLVLSAAFQGTWNLDADIIGRDMVQDGVIGDEALPIPYPTPLNTILGQMTSWSLGDDCTTFWADPTDFARVGYLIDWRVTIPGFHAKFFQDGELYYTTMGLASRHLTFEATVEFDSDFTKAILWDSWATDPPTPLYTRIHAEGGEIPVATGLNYETDIDMVIVLESCETIEERDGNDIIKFVARTAADVECATHPCSGDAGFEWGITVVNGLLDELPACAGGPA